VGGSGGKGGSTRVRQVPERREGARARGTGQRAATEHARVTWGGGPRRITRERQVAANREAARARG